MDMLTLILPHLIRPSNEVLPSLNTPSLNQIIRFARFQAAGVDTAQLYQSYLCDQLALPDDCVYASPLHQQVGMNQIVVQHGSSLAITPAQAQSLCDGLNQFYATQAQFRPLRPDLWCMTLSQPIDWQIENIFNLNSILSPEHAPADWLQLTTEIQMWLHSQQINQNRTPCPINALWLWNAPTAISCLPVAAVATDSVWASHSSQNCQAMPSNIHDWYQYCHQQNIDVHQTMIFSDAFVQASDAPAYCETLAHWETQFFTPIWHSLCSGSLKAVRVICEQGQLSLTNTARFAFWRGKKHFNGQHF